MSEKGGERTFGDGYCTPAFPESTSLTRSMEDEAGNEHDQADRAHHNGDSERSGAAVRAR